MTCPACRREIDRRTVAEASARRWEEEAKALRREVHALRMRCGTEQIRRPRDAEPGNGG